MSFASAVAELQTQLATISGVAEHADQRVESLATSSSGVIDGAYLLRAESVGEPWFDAQVSPTVWFAKMILEICTLLKTDELTQVGTAATRGEQAVEKLLHTAKVSGTVFNSQPPQLIRNGKDRRLVWTWRFSLRYVE